MKINNRTLRALFLAATLCLASAWLSRVAAQVTAAKAGTFTDTRDGKTYRTVEIDGKIWMAENLNYKTGKSWCYDNKNSNCDKYGRLYDWNTATKACPAGWHLPVREEWDSLAWAAGGKLKPDRYDGLHWIGAPDKLKAKNGWYKSNTLNGNGTDDYGFSALPAGERSDEHGNFSSIGYDGNWWTASERNQHWAYNCYMSYASDFMYRSDNAKDYAFSVRCVRKGGGKPLNHTEREKEEERRAKAEEQKKKEEEQRQKDAEERIKKQSVYFTDTRDGRVYRAVKIGGKTWMAENLNYKTPEGSRCFDNKESNCAQYGRLYDLNTATRACPAGWHLPTAQEWDSLVSTVGGKAHYISAHGNTSRIWAGTGKKLKSTRGWKWNERKDESGNGTDDYGFSALPGSLTHFNGKLGESGYWWAATASNNNYRRVLRYDSDYFYEGDGAWDLGQSVRCVQDDAAIPPSGKGAADANP